GRVEPEDEEHRPKRGEERAREEQPPKFAGAAVREHVRQDHEQGQRGQERIENRRKNPRQIAPHAPVPDRHRREDRMLEHLPYSPRVAPSSFLTAGDTDSRSVEGWGPPMVIERIDSPADVKTLARPE